MLRGLQAAGWVAPGVPVPVWYQLGGSLLAPVFHEGSDPPTPFPSAHRQLRIVRDPGRGPTASYLAPQVLQTLSRLCLAFLQPENPAGTRFTLAGLQVGCFPCQMPGSLIWGAPGLLCTALYVPSPAPTAWAGDGDLAHAEGNKTWEVTGCFGSHLKPRGVVWVEGRYNLTPRRRPRHCS